MPKKYPKSDAIENAKAVDQNAYITWDDNDMTGKREALKQASQGLNEFTGVQRANAATSSRYRDFSNLVPNISPDISSCCSNPLRLTIKRLSLNILHGVKR